MTILFFVATKIGLPFVHFILRAPAPKKPTSEEEGWYEDKAWSYPIASFINMLNYIA
jgi:hypothetical protein